MAVVAFVSQKGGVGKGSLARALAVEARRSGLAVKIADLDPGQGSTTDWHKDRLRTGLEPDVPVQMFKTAAAAMLSLTFSSSMDQRGPIARRWRLPRSPISSCSRPVPRSMTCAPQSAPSTPL